MGYLALPAPFTRRSQRAGCAGYTPLPLSPTPSSSAASIASTGSWDSGDDESSSSLVHDCELGCDRRSDDLDPPPSSAPASTSLSTAARIAHSIPGPLRDLAILLPALVFFSGVGTLFAVFPFPTTVHAFIPLALALASWVALSWLKLGWGALRALRRRGPVGAKKTMSDVVPGMVVGGARQRRRSVTHLTALLACTALVVYWLSLGLVPPKQEIPALAPAEDRPRYFIAANLYNNEHLVPRWSSQVLKLVNHLGPERTFVSIYESNSVDRTPQLLKAFGDELAAVGAQHRIVSDTTNRWWPYGTSPERIGLLANARNRALEPLQSPDADVRLDDYDEFTKILFLNDVVFSWDAAVRLLATSLDGEEGENGYDLACGMDFGVTGLYDSWVARDVCGTPMRVFWPYVKDPVSVERLRENQPFEVAACWNGMAAFPAAPYLYRPTVDEASNGLRKRGWKMVDNATYPNARMSPNLTTPIQFRTSGIDACDHSECFLFSYDLHRLYPSPERPPRIIMNPDVRTAYADNWWKWHNGVVRIPVVEWWLYYWSHGFPGTLIDWFVEWMERRRDYCTWAAFAPHMPDRCPSLPGAVERPWDRAG